MAEQIEIRRDWIIGTRKTDNYFWAVILFIGGLGFVQSNPFPTTSELEIAFHKKQSWDYMGILLCILVSI